MSLCINFNCRKQICKQKKMIMSDSDSLSGVGTTMFDIFEVQRERKILIAMEVIEKTVARFNDLDT